MSSEEIYSVNDNSMTSISENAKPKARKGKRLHLGGKLNRGGEKGNKDDNELFRNKEILKKTTEI